MNHLKSVLTTLIAILALTAAIGTASANRFRVSEQEIEAILHPVSFTNGGALVVRCNVTFLGRLHSGTFSKVQGGLVGFINHARVQHPCTGGSAWVYNGEEVNEVLGGRLANSLPWHITYERFEGTLPSSINNIRLLFIDARWLFRMSVLGITFLCVYRTESEEPAEDILALSAGVVTSLRANEALGIEHTAESSAACPEGHYGGAGIVTNLADTSSVTITLV